MEGLTSEVAPAPISLPPLGPDPLVSVVVANYNYGRFVADAVESVIAQSYPDWELIICDDGSTDESRQVLAALESRDPRIRVMLKENGGQVSAWNLAYAASSGEIICFLDSDDAFCEKKLERVVQNFANNSKCGVSTHRYQLVNTDLRPTGQVLPAELRSGWLFDEALSTGRRVFLSKPSELSIRRECADCIFPLPESLSFGDLYICDVATSLTEVASISEPLSQYRLHGSNVIGVIDELDAATLEPMIAQMHQTHRHHLAFVSKTFGPALAAQLTIPEQAYVWKATATLYLLKGRPKSGIEGYRARDILSRLMDTRQPLVWLLLFLLPAPIARRILISWRINGRWNRLLRPFAGALGLDENCTQ
jgi:hypothetical protein